MRSSLRWRCKPSKDNIRAMTSARFAGGASEADFGGHGWTPVTLVDTMAELVKTQA